ncbi:nucleotide-sugar transporter-domain-containing protein [Lactifluus volemus]|nr:nucleotide-sugar transporter-domain-containing protein [Lactifluus volemus]
MAHSDSKLLFWSQKSLQNSIHFLPVNDKLRSEQPSPPPTTVAPSLFGLPLKYMSLVTLAVQNATLSLLMHYSRVSMPPSRAYSAASAVLATELLKGLISLVIALIRVRPSAPQHNFALPSPLSHPLASSPLNPKVFLERCRIVGKEVFRPDCWKLSIPAILYVIQNNLQFVAASNLEAATFQVTYQMKILTTAAFSVILLRRKITPLKWLALFFLALGVGIVQIQSSVAKSPSGGASSADVHTMIPFKGFLAVVAACFTSGLAGVYFEMVLKNSTADLWVRNVQLSLFSLLPALVPIIMAPSPSPGTPAHSVPSLTHLFANFTPWAWATVLTQVLGGLITALVIKYADNIMKGFATSLSIVISFLASVGLFHFRITGSFIVGASVVLTATWLYSQPDCKQRGSCATPFKFLRARRSSNAPPPVSPVPTRPLPTPINPSLAPSLGRRTPIATPYSSPTTPAPPVAAGLALASMRSHSMPSILLPAASSEPPV